MIPVKETLVIVLEKNLSEEQTQAIINAMKLIRGVLSVETHKVDNSVDTKNHTLDLWYLREMR